MVHVVKYMYKLTVNASHHKCNKYMLKKVKLHNITTQTASILHCPLEHRPDFLGMYQALYNEIHICMNCIRQTRFNNNLPGFEPCLLVAPSFF